MQRFIHLSGTASGLWRFGYFKWTGFSCNGILHLGIVDLYVSILSNSGVTVSLRWWDSFVTWLPLIGLHLEWTVPSVSFAVNTGRMRGGAAQRRMSLQIFPLFLSLSLAGIFASRFQWREIFPDVLMCIGCCSCSCWCWTPQRSIDSTELHLVFNSSRPSGASMNPRLSGCVSGCPRIGPWLR